MSATDRPQRPRFFAIRFVRLIEEIGLANQIGPASAWLLAVVAAREDASRYQGPVTYYNGQLLAALGLGSVDTLDRVRSKAVGSGWLSYQPGGRGRPGSYRVVVPDRYAGYLRTGAEVSADQTAEETFTSAPVRTKPEGKCGDNCGTLLPITLPLSLKTEDPPTPRGGGEPARCPRKGKKADPEADPLFARFWSAYPRKEKKPAAARAFAKHSPDEALLARMLAAIARQARSEQWAKGGGEFIPHPATWLNNRRWEDETVTPTPAAPRRPAATLADLAANGMIA